MKNVVLFLINFCCFFVYQNVFKTEKIENNEFSLNLSINLAICKSLKYLCIIICLKLLIAFDKILHLSFLSASDYFRLKNKLFSVKFLKITQILCLFLTSFIVNNLRNFLDYLEQVFQSFTILDTTKYECFAFVYFPFLDSFLNS